MTFIFNSTIVSMVIIFIIFTEQEFSRFKNRDNGVLEQVFHEYNERLFNYLVIKVNGDTHLAEELLSDTFHSIIVSAPKLKDSKRLYSWMLTIADRRFMDMLRKKYRRRKHETEAELEQAAGNVHIEKEYEENEKVIMMQTAMEQLKPVYREILTFKYFDNLPQTEIAKKTGKTESSVESLLFRARNALKKQLEKIAQGMV
ncbi:MAG: RNA polymerase sigma factor [Spirochaetales bacterium]|nr:RNA polymerase sigma factor [Spirochaetales bacterium]